jgi:hypothetical protein
MSSDKKFDLWALLACLGLALAFRLPGLTVFLTADEARSWFGRSIIFLDSLARGDWANTGPGGQVPFIEKCFAQPGPWGDNNVGGRRWHYPGISTPGCARFGEPISEGNPV